MIQINKDYRIDTDKLNWILQKRKVTDPNHQFSNSETPQEKWIDVGYFGKIEHLINRLLNDILKDGGANTLVELKTYLLHVENSLTSQINHLL